MKGKSYLSSIPTGNQEVERFSRNLNIHTVAMMGVASSTPTKILLRMLVSIECFLCEILSFMCIIITLLKWRKQDGSERSAEVLRCAHSTSSGRESSKVTLQVVEDKMKWKR